MGSVDRSDDRAFRVNFTDDGAAKLRDKVMHKLKEFMGDYTDETLVEYVIVLLRNGRRKVEARNELNVFLGDDTDSFVSWLWDHLDSNLDSYVHPEESYVNEVLKTKPAADDSHRLDSESERVKTSKESNSRHRREWKGLVRDADEPPPLRSSVVEKIHLEEKPHQRRRVRTDHGKRSPSPRSVGLRKRSRPDDQENIKREASQVNIVAPRRLLQFAVRDAVATSRPSNSVTEPTLKRLRSVVSTTSVDSPVAERPVRLQSVARVPNPMATVIRAVAEAAEDVTRVKSSGSVFDRLGRGMDVSENSGQIASYGDATFVDDEFTDINQIHKQRRSIYLQRSDHTGKYGDDMTMLENEVGLVSDSTYENDGYDDANLIDHRVTDVSQTGTSGGKKGENSIMQYSVAKNADDIMRVTRNKDQGQPANASQKIVNISMNVNTRKPPPYQDPRDVAEVDGWKSIQKAEEGASKPGALAMKENNNPVTVNGNAKPAAAFQKESQKALSSSTGSYASGRPLEDADSRTLFVSNVHFAATKDSLSRHFNKFGEVLKVVIITDAATGQPTGSAYVEFMRKEAADNALSLDGTSFMSRILKVARRSAAHQEATSIMTWPRIARGSPFSTARFSRSPFPRGIPAAFRPRPLIRPGARSMQWKRDAQAPPGESGALLSGNTVLSSAARGLTYVRTEPKPEANSGTS
uniref:uncharacterized protein LOC107417664 n=1 Tax=Ziziphus jujuba TaxID=326968 RepID=A0A6P3ZR47_ZIZJJ